MVAGYLLRKYETLHSRLAKTVSYVIYLLLFLLGLSVGQNETIVRSFHLIGIKALIITAASVAGSLLLSVLVYKIFFSTDQLKVSSPVQEEEA